MAKLTPMRAIRKKCLDCCCGQMKEVALCTVITCPLYGYRSGHRPKEEQFTTEGGTDGKSVGYSGSFFEQTGGEKL